MSKKLISLLLAVCMLFCLCACGTTETSGNVNNTLSESQTDTVKDNEKNSQVSTNTENPNENDTTQTQTLVNESKPTSTTNQPTHTHNYSNATCTSPKKCSCGVTAGTALGHQFSSATCTSPKICSRCGTTNGNALGHNYSAANCNSPKTCTRCGQTEGSALGHNYVNNKCSRCGKVDPNSLPVRLNDLYLIDSSFGNSWHKYEYNNSTFTDSFGNFYDGAHCYIGVLNEGQYSTHNLNGQYSNFTGSIVAMPNTSTAGTYSISIYVDGVLKYSKSNFSKTTGKVDFSVDVKGGKTLTIKACMDSGNGDSNMNVAVVNAQLTK
ncbi:MAG: NPCBM/NEW2 domain-containing protein [Oscillospiraceae bacterium]|nr:NPCBM/NEW2 domain-containing protein [Oscillospiraceae bacterium]